MLRKRMLGLLEVSGAVGLRAASVPLLLIEAGFDDVTADEVRDEMQYLIDAGLAADVEKSISPENKRYRITKEGRDWRASNPL